MKCKIFTAENGILVRPMGSNQLYLQDAVNQFLAETFPDQADAIKQCTILQSQCSKGLHGVSVTISIFY